MLIINNALHTQKMFAAKVEKSDLWKAVDYSGFQGDSSCLPSYYYVEHGMSCKSDLRLSMDELLLKMKSNTRNEIRRAEKEGCEMECGCSYEEFVPFYNAFCKSKGFADVTTIGRLKKYKTTYITKVHRNGEVLAMHAHVIDQDAKLVFLLFSCSQRLDTVSDKKLIGWGNRFLHFKEMELFKNMGLETYEWGGLTLDENDPRYSIGQFKLSLGGEVYETIGLRTPLYNFMLLCRKLAYNMFMKIK